MVDPTGTDWYRSENGDVMWRNSQDKEYTDENGMVWTNVGDDMTFIYDDYSIRFSQREDENGKLHLSTSRSGIGLRDMEATYARLSTDASRDAAVEYHNNPSLKNWLKFCVTETLGQYTDIERVVGGLSAGVAGYSAMAAPVTSFGRSPNSTYHAFRYMRKFGISDKSISHAIRNDLKNIYPTLREGGQTRTIQFEGRTIKYRVHKFKDGTLNVGSIYDPSIKRKQR